VQFNKGSIDSRLLRGCTYSQQCLCFPSKCSAVRRAVDLRPIGLHTKATRRDATVELLSVGGVKGDAPVGSRRELVANCVQDWALSANLNSDSTVQCMYMRRRLSYYTSASSCIFGRHVTANLLLLIKLSGFIYGQLCNYAKSHLLASYCYTLSCSPVS